MNTREILIKQGMLDDDIIMLIKDAIHENYLTVEFRELTDNQAEIISNFKGWRIDLSRLDKLSDTQVNILSKFGGGKIEISGLDKISESTINILDSFNSDRSEDFIIIINFTIDDNNKDKIFGFIKDLGHVYLGSIGYINLRNNSQYTQEKILKILGETENKISFSS